MDDANYIKVNIYQQTLNSKNIMIESLSIIKQLKIKLEAHPPNQLINVIQFIHKIRKSLILLIFKT